MDNPFSQALTWLGRDLAHTGKGVLTSPVAHTLQPIGHFVLPSFLPGAQGTRDRRLPSNAAAGDNTLTNQAVNPALSPDNPFASLNALVPNPLASQLFYAQSVAPFIQHQVNQMTQYGDLLKKSGGSGPLAGINNQLGNQYGALAAALGAQTAQAPAIDTLMQNVNAARSQQTDTYSLLRSLLTARQIAQGTLMAQNGGLGNIMALTGLG